MSRITSIISAAAFTLTATLAATTAQAKTTVYTCKVTPSQKGAWIGKQLIIRYDEDTGDVTVLDNIINYYLGEPQPAEVEVKNSKRTTFMWVLKNFGASGTDDLQFTSGFRFRASLTNGGRMVRVSSKPLGYSNSFRGKGTCTVK